MKILPRWVLVVLVVIPLLALLGAVLLEYLNPNPPPDWLSPGANIFVGAATLELAAIAWAQIRAAQLQAEETKRAQFRPIIIPDAPLGNTDEIWTLPELPFKIKNVGMGVATNIYCALLPTDTAKVDLRKLKYFRLGMPLVNGEGALTPLMSGGYLITPQDVIGGITMGAPRYRAPEIGMPNPLDRADRIVARLSISYHDIFKVKHVSIFDLTNMGNWVSVAILDNIPQDIGDLDAANGPK